MPDRGALSPLRVPLDAVQRRVHAQILAGVTHAYSTAAPTQIPYCTCGHPDGDHHGVDGELDCSATGCDCPAFALAGVLEIA